MNNETAVPPLLELLARWEQLTLDEGAAIEADQWGELARLHAAKAELRRRIGPGPVPQAAQDRNLLAMASRVQALERSNQSALATKLQATRSRIEGLGASVRHLRGLHEAYRAGARAAWQWYS